MTPRALVLRGRHEVGAIAIPKGREDRVIDAWMVGSTAHDLGDRWLLVWPRPQRLDVETAPGQPLVRDRGWIAFPTDTRELGLRAAEGEVVDAHHGAIRRARPGAAAPVADWLDLGGLVRLDAAPLGDPPAPPALALTPAVAALAARGFSRSDTVNAALAALRAGPGWLAAPLAGLAGAFAGIRRMLPASGPSWLQRTDAWLGRMAMATGLGSIMGARWSRFLEQMIARFDSDVLEALKYAIPLGGGGLGDLLGPGWSLPGARGGLGLSGGGGGAGTGLGLSLDLYEKLKGIYRRAFEQLDAMGRVDEAAWVLAELLGEVAEAVAYLEKRHRYALAAEIAEAKGQPIELAIRLRWRAGDPANQRRAIQLAILHRAFEAAITKCADEPEAARALRTAWAEHRRALGDVVGAVDVLAADPALQPQARVWAAAGSAAGGVVEARLLPRRITLGDEGGPLVARGRAILDGRDPDARAWLVTEVASARARGGWHDVLARRIARAGYEHPEIARIDVAEEALATDLARARRPVAPAAVPTPIRFDPTFDGGGLVDLAAVGRGRLLVALGERGAALLDASGRVICRWDTPAHAIVVGPDRALLLAVRDTWASVTTVDLDRGVATPWRDLAIDAWSDRADELWFVGTRDAVLALDVATGEALWRLPTPHAEAIAQGPGWVSFVSAEAGARTMFRYERPRLVLRDRAVLASGATGQGAPGGWVEVSAFGVVRHASPEQVFRSDAHAPHEHLLLAVDADARVAVTVDLGPLGVVATGESARIELWGGAAAAFAIPTSRARAHVHHGLATLVVRGEGLVVDVATGHAIRRLRDVG